jgi:hypothetical protein
MQVGHAILRDNFRTDRCHCDYTRANIRLCGLRFD